MIRFLILFIVGYVFYRALKTWMFPAPPSSKSVGGKRAGELDDDMIKFIIQDEGPGFDFHSLPDPTAPENIGKPSGRGIFLMKHLSDEVNFKKMGREVELSFYIN